MNSTASEALACPAAAIRLARRSVAMLRLAIPVSVSVVASQLSASVARCRSAVRASIPASSVRFASRSSARVARSAMLAASLRSRSRSRSVCSRALARLNSKLASVILPKFRLTAESTTKKTMPSSPITMRSPSELARNVAERGSSKAAQYAVASGHEAPSTAALPPAMPESTIVTSVFSFTLSHVPNTHGTAAQSAALAPTPQAKQRNSRPAFQRDGPVPRSSAAMRRGCQIQTSRLRRKITRAVAPLQTRSMGRGR